MKIVIFGTGSVGLVTGTCFAELGFYVTCVDIDQDKIDRLTQGQIPIYEPGLETMVAHNLSEGRLKFTTDKQTFVGEADIIFIAVGTPSREDDGGTDLSYVYRVTEDISKELKDYTVIVMKSTVPVGTGRQIKEIIYSMNPDASFDIISNPEFLREGSAIEDFMEPDRVIIGCESNKASTVIQELYCPLNASLFFTDFETAELIKCTSNAFLATKIAFINQIANLCERCGANIEGISEGIGLDKRIGKLFLRPGPGYGGSCFPKDTRALVHFAKNHGVDIDIVEAVVKSNFLHKQSMIRKIIKACNNTLHGKTLCILGTTFKPGTGDMRDAPSLDIIPALIKAGAHVQVFDPQGFKEGKSLLPEVHWFDDCYEAMQKADAVVILTEWNEFSQLNFNKMKAVLNKFLIIDLRNIYMPESIRAQGFDYISIGRQPTYGSNLPKKSASE